ncbi:MAG: IPT/TIG domain-containing protein [Planctomycetes bacterium]|nr:IPT/TIG domain-containing protein [Planctomycetota bacterium]
MRRSLLGAAAFAAALFVLPSALSAQIRSPGEPAAPLLQSAPTVLDVPAPDVALLVQEDAMNEARGIWPLRYGVPVSLPFDLADAGAFEITSDGRRLAGRVRIEAPGAYSLGVEFARFDLPPGGAVFLYDDTLSTVYGAYTAQNEGPDGGFAVEPFPGDSVVIEYSQPADQPYDAHITLRQVVYDYRDVFALESSLNDGTYAGGCTLDVNCPEGDPYELQKRCTVRTLYSGFLCSGSILNNTANDQTPYLYTANHCSTGSSVVVRFKYQRSGCGTGTAPTTFSMSGAQLLANDVDTDGRLLRLNNPIPANFEPYYSGWSRSTSNLTFGLSMHHPSGGPKCISIDTNGGGQGNSNFIGIGLVKVWFMKFQVGGTLGGSSGGPLFDQNLRVRGALTGGPDTDCTNSQYGRFYNFWTEANIGQWLDPLGSGVTNLDGLDPFADLSAATLASIGPTSGPAGGFTSVTFHGSGFDGLLSVKFGGVEAKSFSVTNDTTLTAVSPTGTAGATVPVSVTDTFGTATLANAFTYTANPAPSIDTLMPDSGLVVGGTVVTMTGTNALGVTEVRFDGVPGTNLVVQSATQLKVTTPAGAGTGPVDVLVVGNGNDLLVDGFRYFTTGSFTTLSPGLAGGSGIAPIMLGSGDLVPGGSGFSLTTVAALPNAPGVMLISFSQAAVAFKGGTLFTFPVAASFDIQVNALGQVPLFVPLDASIPAGISFVIQQLFADPGAPAGVSMTNGLLITLGS